MGMEWGKSKMENKRLIFRVKYKLEHAGTEREGIEEEASWFLIDQRGTFYSHGPMRPVMPCDNDYTELIPLIKIGEEYLSVEEIERRLNKCQITN